MITTIIIPVLNRYDLLARCLDSIPPGVPNILVIDNGDEIRDEALYPVARVLRMPSNLGVATSWNLGIKLYPHEPGWLLLNSDAWFGEGAFDVLGADCGEDRITLAGSPGWCCAWVGRGVVDRVGLFCEAFYPAYNEDIDFEQRATRKGVVVARSDANIEHDNSSTIKSNDAFRALNDATFQHSNEVMRSRWAGLTEHETPPPMEWSLTTRMVNSWD